MLAAVAAAMLPTLRSAFPIGAHDQLIRAATVPDEPDRLRAVLEQTARLRLWIEELRSGEPAIEVVEQLPDGLQDEAFRYLLDACALIEEAEP